MEMITEVEAKTKACPLAGKFGASQQLADGPGPHCVASQCMAWRWDSGRGPGPVEKHIIPVGGNPANLPDRLGFRWNAGKKDADGVHWGLFPRLGYCGLAGPGQS